MTIQHAKVGGPPADWQNMKVFEGETEITSVVEVDAQHGWLVRYLEPLQMCNGAPACPLCGLPGSVFGDHARAERVEGRFEIRRIE